MCVEEALSQGPDSSACNPATLRSCKGIFVFFFFSFGDNIHMRKHPQASRFKVKTSLNSNWGWKPSP